MLLGQASPQKVALCKGASGRGGKQMRIYGAKERAPDDMSMLARTASGSQEAIFHVGDKDGRATFKSEHTFLQRADGYSD